MHFPFRRPPDQAWHSRLPQLERTSASPPRTEAAPPPPASGLLTLPLTRHSAGAPVAIRDVLADPVAAERLPSATLVNALLEADAENRALRRHLHARKRELQDLRKAMAGHVAEDSEIRGRLRTLEEVIAALHANLEDLRLQRDQLLAAR